MKSLLVGVAVAVLVLVVAQRSPLAREEERIIPLRHATQTVQLKAGQKLTQRLVLPAGTYTGVMLFAELERWQGQGLSVTVRDRSGQQLAAGRFVQADYAPVNDDVVRLRVPTRWWRLTNPDHVLIEIAATRDVPLKAVRGVYNFGELTPGTVEPELDLALSLLSPTPLPAAARHGVVAGVIFLAGALLIEYALPGRRQWWAMGALLLVLVPVALAGYWWSAGELGIADWDYYFSLHHVYRHSLAQLHTFPFWNPYTCGGTAGLADPEFPVFTPTFLLELLFGIPAGLRLAIYLSVMIGAGGMLLLAKRLGVSPLAGGFSALVVSLSTVTLLEITEGHVNVFAAMWIPWIFWSWLGAYRGGSALVPGIFLALTFYQGGVYLLMYTGLVFIALIFVVPRPRVALAVTIKAGLWALGLSALKLLPVLAWLRQFPDEAYTGSAYTLPYLPQILFGRYLHGAYVIPGQVSGWHEYGAYVGYGVLALALIGLSLFFRRRHVRILLVGLVATLLLSASGPYLAPVFDQLWFFPRSNISRLILLSIIALALLAALGLDHLRRRSRHRLLPVLAAGLVAIDILSLSAQVAEQAFVLPPVYPKPAPAPGPIAFITETFDPAGVGSRTTRAYEATRAGYGTFAYCSVLGPGAGRVRTIHDEGGSRLVAGEAHEVSYEVLEWSPNGALVRITLLQEDTITLNTNYASGWRVNGTPARNVGGLVGVVLPVGEHDVLFSYRAPGWRTGLVVTSLTLLAMIWRIKKRLPFFKKMFTY